MGVKRGLLQHSAAEPSLVLSNSPERAGNLASRGQTQSCDACKTVPMDAGPDALHTTRLGTVPTGALDLGPISPELALVDPELARRARDLLPEPRERPTARRAFSVAPAPEEPAAREVSAEPEIQPPRRRWARAVVLAAAIFAAGAASGTVLGPENGGPRGMTLQVRAAARTTHARPTPRATRKHAAARTPKASSKSRDASARPTSRRRRHAHVVWASNVLGVAASVDGRGVTLVWHPPANSAHVVVVRAAEPGRSVVVYRGRARRFEDTPLRPCSAYRYTIVNYDRRGHRSTGVPTSLVTASCT